MADPCTTAARSPLAGSIKSYDGLTFYGVIRRCWQCRLSSNTNSAAADRRHSRRHSSRRLTRAHHARLSLLQHMIAGAAAGIGEHVAMYPIDTIKTRMQALSHPGQQASIAMLAAVLAGRI